MPNVARRLPIGIPLVITAVLVTKAYVVALQIAPANHIDLALDLALDDSRILGFVLLLSLARGLFQRAALRLPLLWLQTAMGLVYVLDCCAILSLDSHVSIDDFMRFMKEWRIVLTFIKWWHVPIALAAFSISFWKVALTRLRVVEFALIGTAALLLPFFLSAPQEVAPLLKRYSARGLLQQPLLLSRVREGGYSEDFQLASYISQKDAVQLRLPAAKRNVILLIVESLSTVDSKLAGGMYDRTPQIDKIAGEGMIFTNFFANYSDTEGGTVSLLGAQPPLPYPSGSRHLYHAFIDRNSIVHQFKSRGYFTEYLTNNPLSFLGQGDFTRKMGYDLARGSEEVESFRNAPRYAFDCPEDALLFEEFLRQWQTLKSEPQPKFITLLTVSSHLPYVDPLGRGDTEDNVWSYVDTQVAQFYEALKKERFFENGILLILGDHHKMTPITLDEWSRFGETAAARVPLIILGAGVPSGIVDSRIFSQADLFPKLADAVVPGRSLSSEAIYIDRFTLNYVDPRAQARILVFQKADEAVVSSEATLFGSELIWGANPPVDAERIERQIHAQRAAHQYQSIHATPSCYFENHSPVTSDPIEHGIKVSMLRGTDIVAPSIDPSRVMRETTTLVIDFPDLKETPLAPPYRSSMRFKGFLKIETAGEYWLRVQSDDGACLAVDGELVIEANYLRDFFPSDNSVFLSPGFHWVELRYFQNKGKAGLRAEWIKPGESEWEIIPAENWYLG